MKAEKQIREEIQRLEKQEKQRAQALGSPTTSFIEGWMSALKWVLKET